MPSNEEVDQIIAAIWRNGVTNTTAIVDRIRSKHLQGLKRSKALAAFDEDLDRELQNWFDFTRKASPVTYQEAEGVYKEFVYGQGSV